MLGSLRKLSRNFEFMEAVWGIEIIPMVGRPTTTGKSLGDIGSIVIGCFMFSYVFMSTVRYGE